MNRLALINSSNYKAPPTPYGLVYTPDLPGLQIKTVFYKAVNRSLWWSENWGETWYRDSENYIVWTVDQYVPVANLTTNKITLQQVINNIPNNVARAPSSTIVPDGVSYENFEKGQIDLFYGSEIWSMVDTYRVYTGLRTRPIIENIDVVGGVDLSAIYDIQHADITITVTKYNGRLN